MIEVAREGFKSASDCESKIEVIKLVTSAKYGPAYPDVVPTKGHAWYRGIWFHEVLREVFNPRKD